MAKIKKVGYKISAKDETNVAIKSAKKRLKGLSKTAISAQGAFKALAGAMALNVLKNVVTNAIDAADTIGKVADSVGLTTEAYQGLAHAADIAGTEQAQFNSNMTAFVKRVGEAKSNTGPLITFLQKYDTTLLENIKNTRTQEQALNLIADAIKNAKTQTEKAAIANAAFSRAGVKMTLFLKDGAQGLAEMRNRAEDLGVVMEDSLIRDAEKAKDALTDMSKVLSTKLTSAVIRNSDSIIVFADSIISLTESIGDSIVSFRNFIKSNEDLGKSLYNTFNDNGVKIINEVNLEIRQTEARLKSLNESAGRTSILESIFGKSDLTEEITRVKMELFLLNNEKDRLTGTTLEQDTSTNKTEGTNLATEEALLNEQTRLDRFFEINTINDTKNLERITSFLATSEESENLAFDKRQFMIEGAFQSELITSSKRANLLERLEKKHQDNLKKITSKGLNDRQKFLAMTSMMQVKTVVGSLIQMTQGVAQSNKTMFKINKIAGIANAVINTAQGVSKALATYPPPLSFAMAAAQAAAGAIQIATIKSTSFGGGGSAPSLGGAGGGAGEPVNTVPIAPQPTQEPTTQAANKKIESSPQVFNVNISGNPSSEQVADLLELFEDKTDDNVQFNVIQEAI